MDSNLAPSESLQDEIITQTLERLERREEYPTEVLEDLESALRQGKAPKAADLSRLLTEPVEPTVEY